MNALVTGGAGFIGSHIVRALLDDGASVRVLDNLSTGRRENIGDLLADVDLREADITSAETVHAAVRGCDTIFHQAALPSVPRSVDDPLSSNAVNVVGTLNVLLAARDEGVRRVIYASSSSVYGANRELPKREPAAPAPMSPYAVAKLAGEGYCRSFWHVFELETVALRYFNVFGPQQDPSSQYAAVIPSFIDAFLRRRRPVIFGDGEQSRDFTYVSNVVEANLLAATAPGVAGEVLNIACGERITLNHLVSEIATVLGMDLEPSYEAPRAGDVRHSHADISRARHALGYAPGVELTEGLRRTAAHYRSASANGTS
jgi:UDP-glucose 4-epimerase